MQGDAIRLLTVALAVSVQQDAVAHEMLQQDYIRGFERYYREKVIHRRREGYTDDPVYLDEMINYAVRELPTKVPNCRSLTELYSSNVKTEVKHRFITENVSQMLTSLAKRDTIKNSVRQYLHSQDEQNTYAAIESTKFDRVFTDFMVMFERSCAANFRFEGDFVAYVMYSFIRYYFTPKSMDIWKIFREVDYAKRETEVSSVEVQQVEMPKNDNMHIHDLVTSIVAVNDLMFSHSGQRDDARGVCYDIFYMCINILCAQKIEKLNEQLSGIRLALVDEFDRKETRGELSENTSIASKIINAREIVSFLFECVRKGGWSVDNIVELRDQCFNRGKKDREGKNCVWKDVAFKAETSRYLDRKMTAHNYEAFDMIFRGVLSVYTLMTTLEQRGTSLVKVYPILATVFKDKALSRNVNTLEDLAYVQDMIELQREAKALPDGGNHGELQDFDGMVYTYAGSSQNNRENIRRNRQEAYLRGLLDNPQLKQKGAMQTPFSKLQSASEYMTAIPRSYTEYVYAVYERNQLPPVFGPLAIVAGADVVRGKYSNPYYNRFLVNNKNLAEYYLYRVAMGEVQMQSLEWHIGSADMPCAVLQQAVQYDNGQQGMFETYCLYDPLIEQFLLCPKDELQESIRKLPAATLYSLQEMVAGSVYNGIQSMQLVTSFEPTPKFILSALGLDGNKRDSRIEALTNSMGFDTLLGMENLDLPEVQSALKGIKVFSKYQSSVERYASWMGELSLLQNSMVDVIYTLFSHGMFLALSQAGVPSKAYERNGRILVDSLLRNEFEEKNLTWALEEVYQKAKASPLQKVNFRWSNAPLQGVRFDVMDMSCLEYVFNIDAGAGEKETVKRDMLAVLQSYQSPAERFIQMYNFVCIRLNFLRILRDAYDLTFNVIGQNLSTLGCEFDSQFRIQQTLRSAQLAPGSGGMMDIKYASLDTIQAEDMVHFISGVRNNNWRNFSVLCEDLLQYLDKCRQDISALIDYEVATSQEVQSEFAEFGSLFFASGAYTDKFVMELFKEIRPRAKKDSAGFLIMKNSYLRGIVGNSEYFIHSTGRVLEITRGKREARSFSFSKPEDVRLYTDIIMDAKRRNVW